MKLGIKTREELLVYPRLQVIRGRKVWQLMENVKDTTGRGVSLERGYPPGGRTGDYRVIARQIKGRTDVLVVELPSGERLLPVFRAVAEAEMFVWLGVLGSFLDEAWYPRRTEYGELLAMLIGPRRSVRRVALDPSPEILGSTGGDEIGLVCVSRQDFVERLLSEKRGTRAVSDAPDLEGRASGPFAEPGLH